jgi:hypothetical protein
VAFTSDNQPDPSKKKRGKGKKSLMLEAIRSTCGSEQEFLKSVVKIGMGDPENEVEPNPKLLNMVLQRIEPPLKANNACVNFEFNPKLKPHQQATQVLDAASKGVIPPDVAAMFVSSIQSMLKIEEVTEVKEKLDKLEEKIRSLNGSTSS